MKMRLEDVKDTKIARRLGKADSIVKSVRISRADNYFIEKHRIDFSRFVRLAIKELRGKRP